MRIRDLYQRQKLTISFEFFPPKSDEAEEELFRETTMDLDQATVELITDALLKMKARLTQEPASKVALAGE